MITWLVRYLAVGLALLFAFSFVGCSGGGSTAKEETPSPAQVGAVTVSDNGSTATMTVHFNLSTNPPVTDMAPANIRFSIAKLVPPSGGNSSYWQSYINVVETKEPGEPGTAPDGTPTPAGTIAVQGTTERANTTGGVFTNNGDGTYSYKFSFNFRTVANPVAVTYEPNLTHRVAMQVTDNVSNSSFDFIPSNLNATPVSRDIVSEVNCSRCHEKLAFHGGDRVSVKYCVTCHNPGSADANSGNTVDFKVMIHKIHCGEELPSVQPKPTGPGWIYAIWGFGNEENNYSGVAFPFNSLVAGTGNRFDCILCHNGANPATPQGDNWKQVPTIQACGSCHDLTSFTDPPPSGYTLHSGGAQANNSACASCHPASSGGAPSTKFPDGANVTAVHENPSVIEAQKFQYNIISVTDPAGGPVNPGDQVKVTFSVTDPTNANKPYDILADPAFQPPDSAKTLSILIGWDTRDYTNTGSGSAPTATTGTPAQPFNINALTGTTTATAVGDGSFFVISPALPLTASGTGVVAIQGHPGKDVNQDNVLERLAPKNAVDYFPITDATAVPRRSVVDVDKCKRCHGVLSLHGNNRTDEIQVCVICHNPNATDINQRPAGAPAGTPDNKREETIDFKHMIHAIHAGDKTQGIINTANIGFRESGTGIVVYGRNSSINNFNDTRLPSGWENLKSCGRCHITTGSTGTYELPMNPNVLPTTFWTTAGPPQTGTGADRSVPTDNYVVTPTASVCSSCHNGSTVIAHMQQNGGVFNLPYGTPFTETCAVCHGPGKDADVAVKHQVAVGTIIDVIAPPPPTSGGGGTGGQSQADLCGPGPISAQPAGHPNRTDCCSCHGFK